MVLNSALGDHMRDIGHVERLVAWPQVQLSRMASGQLSRVALSIARLCGLERSLVAWSTRV